MRRVHSPKPCVMKSFSILCALSFLPFGALADLPGKKTATKPVAADKKCASCAPQTNACRLPTGKPKAILLTGAKVDAYLKEFALD